MPTYDYRCLACEHEFELFQQMTDPVKRKCPECGKPKLQRLIGTGAGILFKGGGFYETDYRSESYKKAAEAEKKAAESSASSASTNGSSDSSKSTAASDSKNGAKASAKIEAKPTLTKKAKRKK